jgi:hypothetical protein
MEEPIHQHEASVRSNGTSDPVGGGYEGLVRAVRDGRDAEPCVGKLCRRRNVYV